MAENCMNNYMNLDVMLEEFDPRVGKLSDLSTTEKSSIVGAVNECVKNESELKESLASEELTRINQNNELKNNILDFKTNINTEIASLKNDLAAEASTARENESTNTRAIVSEVTRATNKEKALETKITDEVTTARKAESTLETKLSDEITRAKAAEGANTTAIANETKRATDAETTLQTNINEIKNPKVDCGLSTTGTFTASEDNLFLTSARSELRKGMRIIFEATATSGTDFEVGFSERENIITGEHNIISISASNITYNDIDYAHGLTVEGRVQFILECLNDATANITLICNGNSFKQNVSFRQGTIFVPFARSKGLIATDCKLTFTCVDLLKKIWIFGDSYFSYYPERWVYYLKEYGYDNNVLMNGYAGENSLNLHQTLLKLIELATPQYIVWFGGMNDASDTDNTTPSTEYSNYVNEVINICKEKNITPIFATIPNVPSINHNGKNAWIKASGYKYIDMCHAVGADVTTSWYDGMLSTDKVHPTIKGAKALFAQVLLDFPEIMLDN